MESVKARFEFSSPVIQAQTVRNLVTAVLKEKGPTGKISSSSSQGPALEELWQQCSSEAPVVRSSCCDAVVLLVEQDHAELHFILNSVLNLLPSARNVQGLMKVIGRLLQMEAEQRGPEAESSCPYSIRSSPHPFITALENRPDCWPALLTTVHDFIRQAVERKRPSSVAMLAPFLRFLYCEPQRQPQLAALRHALLPVLLPAQPRLQQDPDLDPDLDLDHKQEQDLDRERDRASPVWDSLLRCLCQLVPHMQVESVEALLELRAFVQLLLQALLEASGDLRRAEPPALLLQLLLASRRCLELGGDCRPLVGLMGALLPACRQEAPVEELLVGVALLLLEAPAAQQTSLLRLAALLAPGPGPAPWCGPVLALPLLQLLSCSEVTAPLAEPRARRLNQQLARRLLERLVTPGAPPPQLQSAPCARWLLPLTPWYGELGAALQVLRRVSGRPAAAAAWLMSLGSSLTFSQRLPSSLSLVVTHLLLTGHQDVLPHALDACRAIATADPSQVPALLPVLLLKLGREKEPGPAHSVLSVLPHLGTHKLCVAMVLQTLQALAANTKLRAAALRLLTELWRKQDRVYPELQRLLAQQDSRVLMGKETQWEQVLARAACLRDVCRERPYQHGGDMLAAIVATLERCSGAELAAPAALALQGLQELCRAEVVDVVSTWRSLGPQLSTDSRPLMVKATAELLALVPQLSAKSEEYEKLKEEVVTLLWSYARSKDPEVASCGFRALANFPEMVHTVVHLPEEARPPQTPPDPEKEEKEEEEEEDLSIPGASYVKLLTLTSWAVLPALEVFLTSLVRQEMAVMPRGVYFSALRGAGLRSDQGKTVAGIPAFMLKTYEKNKQPGLKPGLAAGLLLCYHLPEQTDRNGRPIDRFLVGRSRSYQQTLAALIHEVNIQPSEWHRALLLPPAWRGFMSRAFHAVLQGRRADLEMQQKQGKGNPEELQYQQHCAWLWARDQLTNVLQAATKDGPVVQGNSILALSSLAAVLAKYESNLPADADGGLGAGPEFVPTQSWLDKVLETLLSIISSSYQARGQVFPWFLHRSYSGENTASAIARSCASLALSLLVPVLVVWQQDRLSQVLLALRAGLPGSPSAHDSQAVQFHSGLALGLVLAGLQQQRLSDVSPQKDADLLLSCLSDLERCSFNPDLEYNTGCVLGLGLVLASLCSSGPTQQHQRVVQNLEALLVALQESSAHGRMLQEVLAYSVACVCVSAFSGGLLDGAKAEEAMEALRTLTEESQQTPGFSLALGLVVHGLAACGHGKAEDTHPRLLAAWVKILLAEGCPTMQRLAAANGLVSLVGSESYLVQLKTEAELSSQQQGRLNEVIRAISQIVTFSGAIGLQSNCACLVGHLHLAHTSTSHTQTAVPQDLSYLPEKSVVRSLVGFILEAGRKGPEAAPPPVVRTALTPLASVGSSHQYPPLNWSSLLAPLMRLSFGEEVQHQSLLLAAHQAQSSQSAARFLGSWLAPPLVHSLAAPTRAFLYENLALWMRHVADDKLQVHLESLGVQMFQELPAQRPALCRSLLRGLAQAMATPNPPGAVWTLLRSTSQKIFSLLPHHIQDEEVELYVGVARCLSEMSDTEIDQTAGVSELQMEKCGFVLSYLASGGRIPLLALNDLISGVLRGWPRRRVGWILLHTFYQSRMATGANTGVSKRLEWLLELMGLIRNVVYGVSTVACGDVKLATDFLFQVFAGAVVSWADHVMPLLLGVRARWFPWQPTSKPPALQHRLYGAEELLVEEELPQCLLGLSHSLPMLLDKEPWSGQAHKFIDWLLSVTEGPEHTLSPTTVHAAKAALLALRTSADFKKKAVWTRAYGW